jgi:hypothetical protein
VRDGWIFGTMGRASELKAFLLAILWVMVIF